MGMPAEVTLDLTGLWHRETQIVGAYTYGTEALPDGSRAKTFDLALDTAHAFGFERLLSETYRIDEYEDAIAHASAAGRRGAVRIAFDFRRDTGVGQRRDGGSGRSVRSPVPTIRKDHT
jgi:hypothetical protein